MKNSWKTSVLAKIQVEKVFLTPQLNLKYVFQLSVTRVLVLNVQHLFVDLLHGHSSSEHGGNSQVSTVSWIASSHHVFSIEHLLGQFWNGQGPVTLGASAGQRSETWHEKVQPWEWNRINSQFPQISVKLTWKSEARGDTGHGGGHQVVQITVGGGGEFGYSSRILEIKRVPIPDPVPPPKEWVS